MENYVKESGLHPLDFMKILEQILPADLQRNRTSAYNFRHRKSWKNIEWIPHDFSFRYQFPKDLISCEMYVQIIREIGTDQTGSS